MSLLDSFVSRLKVSTLVPHVAYEGVAYHYTSLENLSSILLGDNGVCLWASRHDCLNDASEGTVPKIRFAQACERLKSSGEISEDFYNLIRDVRPNRTGLIIPIIDGKAKPSRSESKTYIASFSEDCDALAMWNYYSKGDRYEGINIGVSSQIMLDSLKSRLNANGIMDIQVTKVVYEEEEQICLLENAILDLCNKYEPDYELSVRYVIGTLLASLKPVFKLGYFSHEKEIRVIVNIFKDYELETPIYYRSNAGYVIPYIKLDFDKSAISRITLGPDFGNEQRKETQRAVVREMLKGHGYRIPVEHSQIPVRY